MKSKFIRYIYSFCLLAGGLALSGCADTLDDNSNSELLKPGYITFKLNVAENVTRGDATINGQGLYNENTVNSVDLFFYAENADDDTPALVHLRENNIAENVALISVKDISEGNTGTENFKVLVVANCRETNTDQLKSTLGTETPPSLNQLKGIITRADASNAGSNVRAFRASEAPEDFVMINFHDKSMSDIQRIVVNLDNTTEASVSLRRVAAKIRVAINVVESYTDADGVVWTPDLDDCRVFFNNGVRTARLDGDFSKLSDNLVDEGEDYAHSDYYSIATSGAKETEDYYYARLVTEHTSSDLSDKVTENDFKYYNDLPLYTYPTKWTEDDMFESHRPMVIVVIEWTKESDDDNKSYEYSYYSMPVNPNGEIVSNAYYFLRARIAMMGSSSPQRPLEIEAETETLNWGEASETTADMRPLRFMQLNQNEFIVNNETSVTIPFYSSHNVEDVELTGYYYVIHGYQGLPQKRKFDSSIRVDNSVNNRDKLYKIEIDNTKKTLTFTHHFFDIWSTTPNLNSNYSSANSEVQVTNFQSTTDQKTETATRRKLYAQIFIEFKIRHKDQPQNEEYEETIKLTLNPAIYVNTIYDYERLTDGGILLNGYGSSNSATGNLGGFTGNATNGYANYLTVVTVSQLNEDDAKNWVLDDPRTNYINNLMTNDSMNSDSEDQTTYWTDSGGPYGQSGITNSTQKGSGVWRMIWADYPNDYKAWFINWNDGQWSPQSDVTPRTLSYYYPAAENTDKYKVMAPKFIWNSRHATNSGQTTITEARRRCATFQQAGYPAGRWRLPTEAEFAFMKKMKEKDVTQPIFGGVSYWTNNGTMDGNNNSYTADGNNRSTSNDWARCVYDLWYWEIVDGEGVSHDNRIPDVNDWMTFTYGDRPRESYLQSSDATRSGNVVNYVERFLQRNGKGVYAVIRDGDDIRLEKVEQ